MEGVFGFVTGNPKGDKSKAAKKKSQKRKTIVLHSIEDATNLVAMVDYELRNRRVGAYLLKKDSTYQFVFAFETEGYHPTQEERHIEVLFDKLENGLKDFPLNESMQVHYQDFRGIGKRYEELEKLWEECSNEDIQLIIKSQQARDKELAKAGKCREKSITLYCTYTMDQLKAQVPHNNWIEKAMAAMYSVYEKVTGEKKAEKENFTKILYSAFLDGYLRWENFLATTIGLDIVALKHEQMWKNLWRKFNRSAPISPPQVIKVTRKNVSEQVKSMTHPVTLLMAEREPVADDMWVNVKNRYVAAMTLLEKPGGWASKTDQLRYTWDAVLSKERLYDIEIFAEITRANESLVQESVRRLLAQSITSTSVAADAGTIDVSAQLKAEKAIEAQRGILEGSVPFWLGFVILVHRNNLDELDEACKYIESCFLRPAWVERERFITWKIWLQTLPITFDKLLARPTNRRHLFLHSEVIGLLPLVKPHKADNQGLQLITDEGCCPIYVDLFSSPKHMMVLAQTRRGKSVMTTFTFLYNIARSMPVIIYDYPRMDGTSTFTDLTRFVGGSYIDITKESINCMELPNMDYLDDSRKTEIMDIFKNFIKNLYFIVVMGANSENHATILATQVKAIIDIAVENFFKDPMIMDRYEAGKGDPSLIPTGEDFMPFTRSDRIGLEYLGDTREAFNLIELRLKQFFSSTVGKAITSKSTVKPNNLLTVFAFTNVNNNEDAAILSLVGMTAALRQSLRYPKSIFFIDEAPILFKFPVISNLVGDLCANGAKAGISVILSAQDPNSIVNSAGGSKIVQNMTVKLIGGINPVAVPAFVELLRYDEKMILRNASKSFYPKKAEMYSQWMLDYEGNITYCRFYPGLLQLVLVANNPDEQILRDNVMKNSPDRYEGYRQLCEMYLRKIRS